MCAQGPASELAALCSGLTLVRMLPRLGSTLSLGPYPLMVQTELHAGSRMPSSGQCDGTADDAWLAVSVPDYVCSSVVPDRGARHSR